jgi:hypothetical protein
MCYIIKILLLKPFLNELKIYINSGEKTSHESRLKEQVEKPRKREMIEGAKGRRNQTM